MANRVDQHFKFLPADMCANKTPLFVCRICGQLFNAYDRTGRANVLGRNAHIAKHVREGRDASFWRPEVGQ